MPKSGGDGLSERIPTGTVALSDRAKRVGKLNKIRTLVSLLPQKETHIREGMHWGGSSRKCRTKMHKTCGSDACNKPHVVQVEVAHPNFDLFNRKKSFNIYYFYLNIYGNFILILS